MQQGGYPAGGYPNQMQPGGYPGGGYPNQMQPGGYPAGGYPGGGYPNQMQMQNMNPMQMQNMMAQIPGMNMRKCIQIMTIVMLLLTSF